MAPAYLYYLTLLHADMHPFTHKEKPSSPCIVPPRRFDLCGRSVKNVSLYVCV